MEISTIEQYYQVIEFMNACSQEVYKERHYPSFKVGKLRISLIEEELTELMELGISKDDPIEILDALCDILYVVYGAMATIGVEPQPMTIETEVLKNSNILPMYVSYDYHVRMTEGLEKFKYGLLNGAIDTMRVGLCAIVYNAFKMAVHSNMDIMGAFNEVHNSNMSKFCTTSEEALKHCRRQFDESIKPYLPVDKIEKLKAYNPELVDIVEISTGSTTIYAIKRSHDGKGLKGPHFFEPNLVQFIK